MITTAHVNTSKFSAVFLDRDGVINKEVNYCHKVDDFYLNDGVIEFLQFANNVSDHVVIITNQAGIAKGYYSEEDYALLNRHMLDLFSKNGIRISAVLYCPHHPDGHGIYKKDCSCRKPASGMIEAAISQFNIKRSRSILIGDKVSDIQSGINAHLAITALVRTGHIIDSEDERFASIVCDDLISVKKYMENLQGAVHFTC